MRPGGNHAGYLGIAENPQGFQDTAREPEFHTANIKIFQVEKLDDQSRIAWGLTA